MQSSRLRLKRENWVCSLDQAKELASLGVYQFSQWFYVCYTNSGKYGIHSNRAADELYGKSLKRFGDQSVLEIFSAFSLSELLLMLHEEVTLQPADIFNHAKLIADLLLNKLRNEEISIEEINNRLMQDMETDDVEE